MTINIAPGLDVVSVISTTSAEVLKLKVGAQAFAVVKATDVMVGMDHD